jgi:hypothetical protein
MTQSSEERVPQSSDPSPTARIIPFERPLSELQRAVQQRAQERLEAENVKPKVSKARRIITFAIALIPVALIFSGFLVAVHAVRVITSLYATPPAQTSQPVEEAPEPPQPGVVILVPEKTAPAEPAKPTP